MTSVFTFAAPDASAHGNVDQSHTFAFTGKVTPIGVNLVGQEFTPTANNIVSVDVQLRSNAQIGQQGFVTATLYQTSVIPGNIIGVAPAVQLTIASTQIVHLDFPSAITLTPGNSYWIVVQSGNPFLWVVQSPGTYTGGTGFVNAIAPVIDFWFITYSSPVSQIPIEIDIKPGSDPNSINTKSMGLVTVAILGSVSFDVTQVDVTTLTFGPAGASPAHSGGHLEDVNGDGLTDLVSHYAQKQTGLAVGDTQACITGALLDGTPISGCDSVKVK